MASERAFGFKEYQSSNLAEEVYLSDIESYKQAQELAFDLFDKDFSQYSVHFHKDELPCERVLNGKLWDRGNYFPRIDCVFAHFVPIVTAATTLDSQRHPDSISEPMPTATLASVESKSATTDLPSPASLNDQEKLDQRLLDQDEDVPRRSSRRKSKTKPRSPVDSRFDQDSGSNAPHTASRMEQQPNKVHASESRGFIEGSGARRHIEEESDQSHEAPGLPLAQELARNITITCYLLDGTEGAAANLRTHSILFASTHDNSGLITALNARINSRVERNTILARFEGRVVFQIYLGCNEVEEDEYEQLEDGQSRRGFKTLADFANYFQSDKLNAAIYIYIQKNYTSSNTNDSYENVKEALADFNNVSPYVSDEDQAKRSQKRRRKSKGKMTGLSELAEESTPSRSEQVSQISDEEQAPALRRNVELFRMPVGEVQNSIYNTSNARLEDVGKLNRVDMLVDKANHIRFFLAWRNFDGNDLPKIPIRPGTLARKIDTIRFLGDFAHWNHVPTTEEKFRVASQYLAEEHGIQLKTQKYNDAIGTSGIAAAKARPVTATDSLKFATKDMTALAKKRATAQANNSQKALDSTSMSFSQKNKSRKADEIDTSPLGMLAKVPCEHCKLYGKDCRVYTADATRSRPGPLNSSCSNCIRWAMQTGGEPSCSFAEDNGLAAAQAHSTPEPDMGEIISCDSVQLSLKVLDRTEPHLKTTLDLIRIDCGLDTDIDHLLAEITTKVKPITRQHVKGNARLNEGKYALQVQVKLPMMPIKGSADEDSLPMSSWLRIHSRMAGTLRRLLVNSTVHLQQPLAVYGHVKLRENTQLKYP